MRWLISLAVLVILIFGVMRFVEAPAVSPDTGEGDTGVATSTTIIDGVPDVTYTDASYGFSITHPETATSSVVQFDGYLPRTQTSIASFVLPDSMYAGTNLGQAGVYIGATTSPKVLAACTGSMADNGEGAAVTSTINGVDFSVATSTDAGAGNYYESTIYRTIRGDTCFEIVEMLHSANIHNFTPGAVVEFDKSEFQGYLDAMVQTLKFE